MKDDSFMTGLSIGLLVASVLFVLGVFHTTPIRSLVRDCSLTGTHIIDNDTVIVCTVLKANRTETPVDKKPEVTL